MYLYKLEYQQPNTNAHKKDMNPNMLGQGKHVISSCPGCAALQCGFWFKRIACKLLIDTGVMLMVMMMIVDGSINYMDYRDLLVVPCRVLVMGVGGDDDDDADDNDDGDDGDNDDHDDTVSK